MSWLDEDDAGDLIAQALEALHEDDLGGTRELLVRADLASSDEDEVVRALIIEALRLLDDGLPTEAAARLELYASPKFETVAECQEAYDLAMGRAPATKTLGRAA